MVAGVTLDADPPALLGHPEHEGPAILGVQVGVGEHEQALAGAQFDAFLKIFEDLPSVILLDFSVLSDPGLDDPSSVKFPQRHKGLPPVS